LIGWICHLVPVAGNWTCLTLRPVIHEATSIHELLETVLCTPGTCQGEVTVASCLFWGQTLSVGLPWQTSSSARWISLHVRSLSGIISIDAGMTPLSQHFRSFASPYCDSTLAKVWDEVGFHQAHSNKYIHVHTYRTSIYYVENINLGKTTLYVYYLVRLRVCGIRTPICISSRIQSRSPDMNSRNSRVAAGLRKTMKAQEVGLSSSASSSSIVY
jgi:hypothetical protein